MSWEKQAKKFYIGIDIDNVISDTYSAFIEKFNANFGTEIRFEEISHFFYLEKNTGIEEEKAKRFIYETMETNGFIINLKPYSDAIKVISQWQKDRYIIHYITARPSFMRFETEKWLKGNGFYEKGSKLDLWDPEAGISDIEFKKQIAEKYGINLLVEDHIDIARAVDIPVLLIDRPWNKGRIAKNIKRVRDWKEIRKIVQNMI